MRQNRGDRKRGSWDVGVITVLAEEEAAVVERLRTSAVYEKVQTGNGRHFHQATLHIDGEAINVVAIRGDAAAAFAALRSACAPDVIVLVGIAGGVHPDVALGDVVVALEVVYYDSRKETPEKVLRRGRGHTVPVPIRLAANDFFSEHGEPAIFIRGDDELRQAFRAMPGAIGSGEAVIADGQSPNRTFLMDFNYKVLAVETETAAVAQAFYESVGESDSPTGWLGIRGISDHADEAKADDYHRIASDNAAAVLLEMLPYLITTPKE